MDAAAERLPHVDEHAVEIAAGPAATWEALGRVVENAVTAGATSVPLAELGLAGTHRFSRYALVFRLEDLGEGRTGLGAETRAVFPKLHGRAYRALVIGTRMHVLVTRRRLGATKRRAERS